MLIIEGKHCNRSLHDDKVYFEIIHEESERSFCKVVHIIPERKDLVGRVEFIYSKNIFVLHPINSRIASMNILLESTSNETKKYKETHYFRAEYVGWDDDSDYPKCRLIERFGSFGEIEV